MADRSVLVRLLMNASQYKTESKAAGLATDDLTRKVDRQGAALVKQEKELDRYSGRLRLWAEAITAFGPGLVPVAAAGTQALAGLTSGLIAVGGGVGTMLLAFSGVGDALKALNQYELDPTAENLEKLRTEFDKMGPAGAHFVRFLDDLEPQLRAVQNIARENMFPGLEDGIEQLLSRGPEAKRIIANISAELGRLSQQAGVGLAGEGWDSFFEYLETDASSTLRDFAVSLGNVATGVANLVVAMAPLSRDFSGGLREATQDFKEWTDGIENTQGFQDFVDYVREAGPATLDFLGAFAMALLDIVKAAAPFGQTLLPILTDFLELVSAIADSPIGPELFTAAAGFIALSRAVKLLGPGIGSLNEAFLDLRTSPNIAATAVERFGRAGRIAAGAAGMGLFLTSLDESNARLKALQSISGGVLAGFGAGGPWGAAFGGAVGVLAAFSASNEAAAARVDDLTSSLDENTGALTENTAQKVANELESNGALEAAQELGINLDTVTAAIMGNSDALADLTARHQLWRNQIDGDYGKKAAQQADEQRGAWETLSKAVGGGMRDLDAAQAQQKRLNEAVQGTTRSMYRYSESAAASRKATREAREAARESAREFIDLGASADDAKVSLREWLKQLEDQAAALNAFTDNALKAAKRGLDEGLIASLKELGPVGAMRMRQLANGTQKEIARANAAFQAGEDAINRYARLTVPPKHITVDGQQAFNVIAAVKYALSQIHDKTVNVSMIYKRGAIDVATQPRGADGLTVPGQRYPYGDKVTAFVAPGEEIVSNRYGGADKNRGPLKAASRGAKLAVVGYADGGTAGKAPDNWNTFVVPTGEGKKTETINVGKGLGAGVRALVDLQKSIKGLNAEIRATEKSIRQETNRRDALADQLDQDRTRLQGLISEFYEIRDAVKSGLTKDIFERIDVEYGDVWRSNGPRDKAKTAPTDRAPTFDEIMARLATDTANANAFSAAQNSLEKYLKGDALLSVTGSGDLGRAQQFASFTPEQLAAYQASFDARSTATTMAGNNVASNELAPEMQQAAQAVMASEKQLDEANRELNESNRHLRQLERAADRQTEVMGRVRDHVKDLRDDAREARQEAKEEERRKRGDAQSAARSRK